MDIPTLLLAIYGAGLSTLLGIKELRKNRRSLKIILESVHWMEIYRIVITNPAQRPITITGIHLAVRNRKAPHDSGMPTGVYWTDAPDYEPPKLPLSLKDGELAIFWLSDFLSNELYKNKSNRLYINVYDAEGRIYSKYGEGEFDPRYGYRTGKIKPPNLSSRIYWHIRAWYWKITRQ